MEPGSLDFERPIEQLENRIAELSRFSSTENIDLSDEINKLKEKVVALRTETFANLTPWQRTQLARHSKRPLLSDYLPRLFTNFIELHGDRRFGDDRAITAGLAKLNGEPVVIIGHRKGKDTRSNLTVNFGMPHPEGYRKACRIMKLAEKFHLPLITFIDTPGAYPGLGAEERGQAEAIAVNLATLSSLQVPIIVVILGEGGSGGALGIGVGDRILMLSNAIYSVASPEACAAILWKDRDKVEDAAKALALTAQDLSKLEIIDEIIEEPLGGAHRDYDLIAERLKASILKHLKELRKLKVDQLVQQRYEQFRKIGRFEESS